MPQHSASPNPLMIGLAGAVAMAAAMGFGRFFFTPVLPGMMTGVPLSASEAGLIAAGNFAGYLAGALLASQGWASGRERSLAIGGLSATALLLAAMAVTASVPAFIVIRLLAGMASAFAMIFTTAIVLPHAVRRPVVQSVHFAGVGAGIALSSVVAFLINRQSGDAEHGWRLDWIGGAVIVALALLFVVRHLPATGTAENGAVATGSAEAATIEPPMRWTRPLVLLTLSYGLFGFGYVVTATFLVAIVRMAAAGPAVEAGAWLVTGLAAAVALFLWQPASRRFGLATCYLACLVLEAIGVLASVLMPPISGALIGGLLLGLTFMTITAYGLQIARMLSPDSPRRALALMTAAFGTGQIVGPLVAGWATQWSGSFTLASLIAASILFVAAALMVPVARHRLS